MLDKVRNFIPAWQRGLIQRPGRQSLFWAGKDKCNGGQCLVAWDSIRRPKIFGGLGIKNLKWQAIALRVRWEWLKRTDPHRPWQGLPMMENTKAREVFDALINIKVGSGGKVLFWRDKWIHGVAAADIAPLLVASVQTRMINNRTVQQALEDGRWMHDFEANISFTAQIQCMHLCHAIATVECDPTEPDGFTWPASASGVYTTKSVYDYLCSLTC